MKQQYGLDAIEEKVRGGERLTADDGCLLFEEADLLRLGTLARQAKERRSGPYAYFNVNRHLNLTNVCVSRCRFCAFCRDEDHPEAYLMGIEEALAAAEEAIPMGITELHIVSGLSPLSTTSTSSVNVTPAFPNFTSRLSRRWKSNIFLRYQDVL